MKKMTLAILVITLLFVLTGCNTSTADQIVSQTPVPSPSMEVSEQERPPSDSAISLERAIELAYDDLATRGITATFHTDSGISWERGQWVWELEFRTQGERMPIIEYYISVDTGAVIKFEWDD